MKNLIPSRAVAVVVLLTCFLSQNSWAQAPPSGSSSGGSSQMPTLGSGDNPSSSGIMEKMSEAGKRVKDLVKDGAREVKDDIKTIIGATGANSDDNNNKSGSAGSIGSGGSGGGFSAGGSVKIGESSLSGSSQIGGKSESGNGGGSGGKQSENPLTKLFHKAEDTVVNLNGKLMGESKNGDSASASASAKMSASGGDSGSAAASASSKLTSGGEKGSSGGSSGGGISAGAQAKLSLGGGKESGGAASVNAQAKLELGSSGSSSASAGNGSRESKSTTMDVYDRIHELSKKPMEAALKPVDKVLGLGQDPLVKMYDNSHEVLRKPIDMVAKPVENMFSGAFKTSEEAKRESEKLMSEQDRREMKMREERLRKEGRSVLGEIADRAFELVEKPYEIILKPVDRLLGLDKDGQKDPLIKLFEEIYSMSKRPIDVLAKPFENILRKMAEGEQGYQMSVRVNPESSAAGDPKLFTRLADGALNIAERVMTGPLEIAMRPLGYDGQKKKNPLVESTHQLKNATMVGLELFTKPMDRIVKEIADIGAKKSEAEKDADRERRRQEASRLVRILDKLHEYAQTPWEIVLRPVSRVLGYSREGRKEPLLKAWDVVHQVVRTPIQVVSKPVEDALLGEQKRQARTNFNAELKIGSKAGIQGKAQIGSASASASAGKGGEEDKENIFVNGIKKIEELAVKPFDKILSPIRKLILGEDGKSRVEAKATVNTPGGKVKAEAQVGGGGSSNADDKIVKTVENINNVVLKPLGAVTQPISDLLTKSETKIQAQAKSGSSGGSSSSSSSSSGQSGGGQGGSQSKVSAAASAQMKGGSIDGSQSNMTASASAQMKAGSSDGSQNKMSATASAQVKKN